VVLEIAIGRGKSFEKPSIYGGKRAQVALAVFSWFVHEKKGDIKLSGERGGELLKNIFIAPFQKKREG